MRRATFGSRNAEDGCRDPVREGPVQRAAVEHPGAVRRAN